MVDDFIPDEDKALFQEHMRTVIPLKEKTNKQDNSQKIKAVPMIKHRAKPKPETASLKNKCYLSDFIVDTVLSETILSYAHPSLPKQRFKELKNGTIRWEARLDLHGMKSEDARTRLCQFIQYQAQEYKRCLLIIHGKGGYLGAPPVIKNLLNRWLPQIDEVLAFHSALPKDGGEGAVYVLLKRNET